MVQNQKKLIDAHKKAEKLVKIYWLCRAEKDNHYKLFNLLFFQILQISLLFVLFDQKKLKLTVQVPRLFNFLLHSRIFQRKNKESVLLGFLKWAFLKKPGCFFWVVFFYNNPVMSWLMKYIRQLHKYGWRHVIDTIIQLYMIVGLGIKVKSMSVRSCRWTLLRLPQKPQGCSSKEHC